MLSEDRDAVLLLAFVQVLQQPVRRIWSKTFIKARLSGLALFPTNVVHLNNPPTKKEYIPHRLNSYGTVSKGVKANMPILTRPLQTKVKHYLLSKYLHGWGEIIVRGLFGPWAAVGNDPRRFDARLLYVDGFGSTGRYMGDDIQVTVRGSSEATVWGSPLIGVQALDNARRLAQTRNLPLKTCSIIFEKERAVFFELQTSLALAGHANRVVSNPETLTFEDGRIYLIHGDFLDHVQSVLELARRRYTKSFFNLDTYGPKGIPWNSVVALTSSERIDSMIYFPYQDLHKKQGMLPKITRSPQEQKIIQNYDLMFGTEDWHQIANTMRMAGAGTSLLDLMEPALVDHYVSRLREADTNLVVKKIRIPFPGSDRPMHHLIFTTHDPCGALRLNADIRDTYAQQRLWGKDYEISQMVKRHRARGQHSLWELGGLPSEEVGVAADDLFTVAEIDGAKAQILGYLMSVSSRATKREIYAGLVDTLYTEREVEAALSALEHEGMLSSFGPRNLNRLFKLNSGD